eukprot:1158151-Pelagomonas_calceolata.AAC.4
MHDRVETSSTLKHDSYGTVLSGSSDILRQTVEHKRISSNTLMQTSNTLKKQCPSFELCAELSAKSTASRTLHQEHCVKDTASTTLCQLYQLKDEQSLQVKPAYLMAANNEATLSGHCRPYMHVFERQRGMRTLNIQQTSLQNPYKHLKDDLQLPHKLRAKLPQLSAQCLTQWGQGKVSPPSAPYTVAMRVSLDSAGLRRLCT